MFEDDDRPPRPLVLDRRDVPAFSWIGIRYVLYFVAYVVACAYLTDML